MYSNSIYLLFVLIFSWNLNANFTPDLKQQEMLKLALEGEGEFYSIHEFISEIPNKEGGDLTIRYIRFGSKKGPQGAIAISTGFTEAAVKYTETAKDLIEKGYSPIYVINHRGQGQSDRVLVGDENEIRHKGYVENFFDYVEDFDQFVKIVSTDKGKNSEALVDPEQFYLLAHSMGGAVAANYIFYHENPFSRVILSSPMLKVKLAPVPFIGNYVSDGLNTWLSKKATTTEIIFGHEDWLNGGVWKLEDKEFSAGNGFSGKPTNHLTSDPSRFWFHINLINQHPANIAIGGATYGWGHEALDGTVNGIRGLSSMSRFLYNNRVNSQTGNEKTVQFKVFQAGKDSVVDNLGQDWFCDQLIRTASQHFAHQGQRNLLESMEMAKKSCELVTHPFVEAEHEIFLEQDSIRNAALEIIVDFFN